MRIFKFDWMIWIDSLHYIIHVHHIRFILLAEAPVDIDHFLLW